MGTGETEAVADGFVAVTEENLACLTKGCFVRVGTGGATCWVEVHAVDGDRLSGAVHPELSAVPAPASIDYCEVASIRREQITALGCYRYCFC